MLIHFVGTGGRTQSLTLTQSRRILQFCLSSGANLFTVDFPFVKGEESEKLMQEFYERLSPFAGSERLLENIGGDRFKRMACWILNERSIELILKETDGDLFAYDRTRLPEDWLFYVGDSIFLQIVTHEQEAILRISEAQYAKIKESRSFWSACSLLKAHVSYMVRVQDKPGDLALCVPLKADCPYGPGKEVGGDWAQRVRLVL
jgi:hypothetical protein